jgi:hypothetical protein
MFAIVATLVVIVASSVVIITVLAIKGRNLPEGQTLQWDSSSVFSSPPWGIFLVIIFATAYFWRLRHG